MKSLIAAIVVVLLAAGGAWWYLSSGTDPDAVEPIAEATPESGDLSEFSDRATKTAPPQPATAADQSSGESEPVDETLVQPPSGLDDSDGRAQAAAADLSPKIAVLMSPREQVRKWVLMTDLMAAGQLPNKRRPLDYPVGSFEIEKQGDRVVMSDANYQRVQPLIDRVVSMEPERVAVYYDTWQPLLESAYGEQGKPGSFHQRVTETIDRILDVEPLTGQPELVRPNVMYKYKDPELEKAPELNKWLWRMGPDNMEKLQAFLRELRPLLEE